MDIEINPRGCRVGQTMAREIERRALNMRTPGFRPKRLTVALDARISSAVRCRATAVCPRGQVRWFEAQAPAVLEAVQAALDGLAHVRSCRPGGWRTVRAALIGAAIVGSCAIVAALLG